MLSVARIDDRYVLEFDDGRSFMFDPDARTVTCPQPIDATVRHQLLDQVLPRVLEHLGHLMIHASAVRTSHGVVMFVADTGAGKSTLAASFQTAGVELLSDDCMQLDPRSRRPLLAAYRRTGACGCGPTVPTRSWRANRTNRCHPAATSDASASPGQLLPLQPPSPPSACSRPPITTRHEITFSPVTPARAVSLLLAQCFRLDPTDAASTKRTFERCADVVERVPVVELAYPRDYERLPEVRDAVLERAATGDWTSATPA